MQGNLFDGLPKEPTPFRELTSEEAVREGMGSLRRLSEKIQSAWDGVDDAPWGFIEVRLNGIEGRINQLRMWFYGCPGKCIKSGRDERANSCIDNGCQEMDQVSALKDAYRAIQGMARFRKPKKEESRVRS